MRRLFWSGLLSAVAMGLLACGSSAEPSTPPVQAPTRAVPTSTPVPPQPTVTPTPPSLISELSTENFGELLILTEVQRAATLHVPMLVDLIDLKKTLGAENPERVTGMDVWMELVFSSEDGKKSISMDIVQLNGPQLARRFIFRVKIEGALIDMDVPIGNGLFGKAFFDEGAEVAVVAFVKGNKRVHFHTTTPADDVPLIGLAGLVDLARAVDGRLGE